MRATPACCIRRCCAPTGRRACDDHPGRAAPARPCRRPRRTADFDDALAALTGGFPAEPREPPDLPQARPAAAPDTAPAGRAEQAAAAFARLAAAWQARHETVTGGRHRYVLGPALAEGDLATVRGPATTATATATRPY